MLSDLLVESIPTQHRTFIGARRLNGKFIKGKVGKGNKVIAKLLLRIGFDDPGSTTIAHYVENGKWPRKFLFFTDKEALIIADAFSAAVRSALRGEDPIGAFRKFGF